MTVSNASTIRRVSTLRLAPIHPEAADWSTRVVAQGASVSTATLANVSRLCYAIDAAGIRDRFLRLNVFSGTGLNAAITPLFRGQARPTRNMFFSGADFTSPAWLPGGNGAVTRVSGGEAGPLGYGIATKLTTPSSPFNVRQMYQRVPSQNVPVTLSVWMKTNAGTRQIQLFINGEYLDTVTVTSSWQRFTKTHTSTVTANDGRSGLVTVDELSDSAGFILAWGAQIEYGSSASSYVDGVQSFGGYVDNNAGGASAFVSGDYVETVGLTAGNTLTKYLDTGFSPSLITAAQFETMHFSAWHGPFAASDTDPFLLGSFNSTTDRFGLQVSLRTTVPGLDTGRAGKATTVTGTPIQGARQSAFLLNQRTATVIHEMYRNGSLENTSTTATTGIAGNALSIFVFSLNNSGTRSGDAVGRTLRHYSIGLAMTAAQVAAFYSAMLAFNTSMGRTS